MIPHIEAVGGVDPQLFTGKVHGGRVGLAHRQGVGTDSHAATGKLGQGGQQRFGEKARLVGDYAPGQFFLVQPLDEIHHPLIGSSADTEVRRVVVEQGGAQASGPQLFEQLIAKPGFEQPERAVGGGLSDDGVRERRKAFAHQHMVDGGAQVRRRIEQGAIQVKQHTAQWYRLVIDHQPCSGRMNSTM